MRQGSDPLEATVLTCIAALIFHVCNNTSPSTYNMSNASSCTAYCYLAIQSISYRLNYDGYNNKPCLLNSFAIMNYVFHVHMNRASAIDMCICVHVLICKTVYTQRALKEQGREWLVASYTSEEFGVTNSDEY